MNVETFIWAYIIEGGWKLSFNPFFVGFIIEALIIFFIYIMVDKKPNSGFSVFFLMIYDYVYSFFEDILGTEEKKWTKIYITTLFFIILISNLLWVFLEIWGVGFPELANVVSVPTTDINFNISMAVIGVLIILYEQFSYLWFLKAFYEYVPIFGKWYIPYEKWHLPKVLDFIVFIFIKIFDIIISLFLGLLDIVWHIAKVISLSFRLFWNMVSWWMLMWMLLVWTAALTNWLLWFDFPVLLPIILHLQWLLVALIQALVFPLLVAIFIKVAKTS